ncbi:5'-nucleotidase C-terminal domain-containing protein [Balneolales bacterium ANBcel1]|nr:5'-nucleotidase C-terminal domain-containing protein [Balneolales bacterium ANBcel1]
MAIPSSSIRSPVLALVSIWLPVLLISGPEASAGTSSDDSRIPADTVTIAVMATADVHGRVRAWDYYRHRPEPRYALSKVATLADSIRGEHRHTLLLDAGDWLQGNPFAEYFALQSEPDIRYPFLKVADQMNFDAIVLGNHEFNFGIDYLNRQISLTETPILGANIYHHLSDDPAYPPYIIQDIAGIRVAVIGLTTPGSAVWDRAHVEGVLDFGDGVDAAHRYVTEVREQEGADVVVILAHSGLDGTTSYHGEGLGAENFGRAVGEQVAGVDLLVLGHTHSTIDDVVLEGLDGRAVGVIQPGRWASHLGVAMLELVRYDDGYVSIISQRTHNLPVEGVEEHPQIVEMTEQAHLQVVEYVTEPMARTPETWSARDSRMRDTPIIDLINHVQKKATGAQLSAAAAFNTSVSFGPGDITRGDIALLYPYFNTLYKLEITGAQLREFLEYTSRYYLTGTGYDGLPEINREWPGFNYDMVSGVDYVLDLRLDPGQRVTLLEYDGEAVADDDRFTIAVNSYRTEGGGGFDMLENARVLEHLDRSVGDMILEYLKGREEIRHQDVFEENWHLVY